MIILRRVLKDLAHIDFILIFRRGFFGNELHLVDLFDLVWHGRRGQRQGWRPGL